VFALTAAGVLLGRKSHRWSVIALGALLWLVLEAVAFEAGHPRGRLRITFLDVGQGDSMIVDFPDGRAMLIDGGGVVGSPVDPGARVVAPTLRARRRSSLDLAVLSHPHPDHFIGLASTLPRLRVGRFWDTGQGEREGAGPVYASILEQLRARHVPIDRPGDLCGKGAEVGGATLRVLGPCPVIEGVSANDNSFVLHLRFGDQAALLVGDAEVHEENRLLALGASTLHANLLKVGHHGSRTSSSGAFLDAVRPSVAVITSGVRNRYGHPSAEALGALRERNIRVLRSDRHGGIVWETDGHAAMVRTRLSGR
jgi:competence protein ComEC